MHPRTLHWLLIAALIVAVWPASSLTLHAQTESGDRYEDPDDRFSVPVPSGWTADDAGDYGLLTGPEGGITIAVLAVEADSPSEGIADAWDVVDPECSMEPLQEQDVPPQSGGERAVVITYDMGQESGEVVQAIAEYANGTAYVLLIRADVAVAQERSSQVNIVASGLEIAGMEDVDLQGVEPLAFEGDLARSLETYITETMEQFDVPGMTVAVVQNGEVVYREAFGVADLDDDEPMQPETRMMIGSTTKSMTTMMLATMVDDGIIDWDTPVIDILPSFAVADPELTPEITVRDLVCACTGVPRRDFELIFNAEELTDRDIIESVSEFEFFTPIGEAFQYSNQMVAVGGYTGAAAVHGAEADLHDAYLTEVHERVLQPIGMGESTFSFDEVMEQGSFAMPHGVNLDGEYEAIPLNIERTVVPVAPSGGLWSNVDDLSRYLMTLLDAGTAPDGTVVVSEEQLRETWQPQVPVDAETSYGLGWFVESYKGQPLIQHGGATMGFSADLAVLPDADLGVVILINGQGALPVNQAVRYRVLELVFEQEHAFHAQAETLMQDQEDLAEADTAVPAPSATPAMPEQGATPSTTGGEPAAGSYANEALGTVVVEVEDGNVVFDAGEFTTGLRAVPDATESTLAYITEDPPVAGLLIEFRLEGDDPTMILRTGLDEYIFRLESTPAATPSNDSATTPVAG